MTADRRRQTEGREFLELMRKKLLYLETLLELAFDPRQSGYFREMDKVIDEIRELMNEQEIKGVLSG